MKKRLFQATLIMISVFGLYTSSRYSNTTKIEIQDVTSKAGVCKTTAESHISIEESEKTIVGEEEPIDYDRLKMVGEIEIKSEPLPFPDSYYDPETETFREEDYWDDMELVALVCVAEAEGESEYGKRLVIDSIFNRVDSEYFPNTISEVVYARDQYECVWNGRIDRVEYNEYIANLVMEELNHRTNSEVIYFKTGGYFGFGTPIVQEGSHYFSAR